MFYYHHLLIIVRTRSQLENFSKEELIEELITVDEHINKTLSIIKSI